jgi:hypothetical protein
MIKLKALICFLAIGAYSQDLCFFNGEVPVDFPTLNDCNEFAMQAVDYMNEDLINRNIKLTFQCVQINNSQGV